MKKNKHLGLLAELMRPHTYTFMLVSSVALVLLAPLVDNSLPGRALLFVIVLISLLSSAIAVSATRAEKIVGIVLAALVLIFIGIAAECHGGTFESAAFWLMGDILAFLF